MEDLINRLRSMGNTPEENCKILEDAIDAIEALQKDAARYRWLRSKKSRGNDEFFIARSGPFGEAHWSGKNADGLIDAEIRAAQLL